MKTLSEFKDEQMKDVEFRKEYGVVQPKMNVIRSKIVENEQEYYISLIERLRHLPDETEWLEYKVNNGEPDLIGEYISALSNSAAICERETAYLLWGINDSDHEVVGTAFSPKQKKGGK